MTASLHTLPVSGDARERVSLTFAEIARMVAEAQESGYRTALTDAKIEGMERNRLVTNFWATYAARRDILEAGLRKLFARPAAPATSS